MAGKGSKERRKKGVKRRKRDSGAGSSSPADTAERRDEGGGGGTMMGLRGGFKTMTGQGEAKKKGKKMSLLDVAFYLVAAGAAVVLVTRYTC